jgi:hypothetical protein
VEAPPAPSRQHVARKRGDSAVDNGNDNEMRKLKEKTIKN